LKKRIIISLITLLIVFISIITFVKLNTSKNNNLTKIKLAEVTHSVFYAPLYVAIENGYFEDEGIDLELILTPGADKVASAVLSNDVNVGFAGPESAIYVYTGNEKDYIQTFAGLTKRDGQFIVSRNKDFKLEDLIGKEILVGRYAGMPSLNFINALKNSNIDISKVNINYSVEFAALSGSFISGVGDYVNLFEPNATNIENEGYGYVVASIGELSGEVPYTAFYARKSYLENNKELLTKFTNAIAKGLKYVKDNESSKIADVILPQFPDISKNSLTTIIDRYKQYDSWLENPFITEESFENLENIMIDSKTLEQYVPYNKLIVNLYNE
jgi:NitT/TauT family transport system substrate-binding protein